MTPSKTTGQDLPAVGGFDRLLIQRFVVDLQFEPV